MYRMMSRMEVRCPYHGGGRPRLRGQRRSRSGRRLRGCPLVLRLEGQRGHLARSGGGAEEKEMPPRRGGRGKRVLPVDGRVWRSAGTLLADLRVSRRRVSEGLRPVCAAPQAGGAPGELRDEPAEVPHLRRPRAVAEDGRALQGGRGAPRPHLGRQARAAAVYRSDPGYGHRADGQTGEAAGENGGLRRGSCFRRAPARLRGGARVGSAVLQGARAAADLRSPHLRRGLLRRVRQDHRDGRADQGVQGVPWVLVALRRLRGWLRRQPRAALAARARLVGARAAGRSGSRGPTATSARIRSSWRAAACTTGAGMTLRRSSYIYIYIYIYIYTR